MYSFKIGFHEIRPFDLGHQFDFYPHIRSTKPYNYNFFLARKQGEVREWFKKLSTMSHCSVEIAKGQVKYFYKQTNIVQVSFFLETKGNYGFRIGHKLDKEGNSSAKVRRLINLEYDGYIKILHDDNEYIKFRYNDSNSYGYAGYGVKYWGNSYFIPDVYPGWYSFMPNIFSTTYRTIGFDISRGYYFK